MITLGIPTRGRPVELVRCVNSALAMASGSIRTVLLFGDDRAGYNNCPGWPNSVKFLSEPRRYYYHDLNLLYRKMKESQPPQHPLDLFVISSDDDEFVVPGWDHIARNMLYETFENGMGVVTLWQAALATYISRARLFDGEYDGFLAPEDYMFYFGDSERVEDLKERGQYAQSPRPLVRHTLFAVDDLEARHSRDAWYDRDKRVFDRRMAMRRYVRELEARLDTDQPG